jgi:hypothetical protein
MEEINGKVYPLWNKFVERKEEWIGGILHDNGDSMDRAIGLGDLTTEIRTIELRPNGEDSAWFGIVGKEFSCGFDVKYGGIVAGEEGWVTFSGYGGHTWRIKQPEKVEQE